MRTFVLRARGLLANLAAALILMALLAGAQQAQVQCPIEFNAGGATAPVRRASCTPAANIGTISALICTPAVPGNITAVAPNNSTVGTFS